MKSIPSARQAAPPGSKTLLRSIKWGLWAAPLAPLIVTRESPYSYTLGRAIFFRIDIEILLVLYLVLILLDKQYLPSRNSLVWSVVAYSGAVLLTTLVSLDPYRSWWGNAERMDGCFATLHYCAFLLIVAGVFRLERDWITFFNISLAASLWVAVEAFVQRFQMGLDRTPSMLGAPPFAATYAIFQIFFAVMILHWEKMRWTKLWGALALAVNLVTLWLTATRGGILGLGCGILAVAIGVLILEEGHPRLRKAALAAVIFFVAAATGLRLARGTAAVRWNFALQRLSELSSNDMTANTRLISLRVGWEAFRARPFLGYGPELFAVAYTQHFNPQQLTFEQGWFDRAHNKLADVLVMEGSVGLVLYLTIFVAACWLLYGSFKRQPNARWSILVNFGMVVAYFIQNLFLFELPVSYIIFYAFLGFIIFVARETRTGPRAVRVEPQKKTGPPRLTGLQRAVVGLVAAVMIFSIVEFNIKAFAEAELGASMGNSINDPEKFLEDFRAALSYKSWPTDEVVAMAADQLSASGKTNDLAYAKVSGEVAAEIEKKITAHKDLDPRTYFRLGILYNRMAATDRSYLPRGKAVLEAGIQRFPNWPEGYDALGENYLLQGKTDEGLALFERAVGINPMNAGAHWMYAFALLWSHREQEGLAELETALERHYDYHHPNELKQLINVYYRFGNFSKAIQFGKELVEIEPRQASHHEALAELYKHSGNRAEAWREMRAAVELDPRYASRAQAFFSSLQADPGAAQRAIPPNP